ncbi:DNA-directed RNA polymerase III, subunit Rpc31 [Daldinia bambusicola]|nr:DNA-directed RNA polymerase III, subunit Rpc31 [Daldinia bambusicola]
MSGRGGRGGGRGGRGGRGGFGSGRKAAPQGMPGADEPGLMFNEKPQDTYPKSYHPPLAPPLDDSEARAVASFVAFRRAFHSTPFYTHRHLASTTGGDAATSKPGDPVRRAYGQPQINARFAVKNRATLDPFQAVPMYSHKFADETRTLPDLRAREREYVRALFPEELWATLEGKDAGGPKGGYLGSRAKKAGGSLKRKAAAAAAVVVDGDPFASDDEIGGPHRKGRDDETEEERKARIEAAIKDGDNEDAANEDVDLDEEEEEMSQEDDDYGDDEGGDYDAEAYFDGGDNDDYGEDEGVGESAMDF